MSMELRQTKFGWAHPSNEPPADKHLLWMKLPEQHLYEWDDDGWHRLEPPEYQPMCDGDLPHG